MWAACFVLLRGMLKAQQIPDAEEKRMNSLLLAKEPVIDLDSQPFLPAGWSLESHRPGGQMRGDLARQMRLWLAPEQQRKVYSGHEILRQLEDQPTANACLLDLLLERVEQNPRVLPESWKYDDKERSRYLFFWGTLYRNEGALCVRYLRWHLMQWEWSYGWVDSPWKPNYYALLIRPQEEVLLPLKKHQEDGAGRAAMLDTFRL